MASTSTSGREDQATDTFVVVEPPNKKMKCPLSVKHFDVFINHRGPDTKENLAQQIYNSLQKAGIQAYLDCKETQLGELISSAIKNAIFSATVHIAIFSPRYTESPWCLAELDLMFQTKARIIPLFYHVEPSDFRRIKERVAQAFSEHEKKGRYADHVIQRWKDCLQNVSGIMGYQIKGQNDDLNKLCCEVVSAVVKEKGKRNIPRQVTKYAVGLDELVKDFQYHCQSNGEMRDKIIGIFGMGGSGKTTLAKDLFNRKHSEFSGSSILFDVRENDVKGALTSLQSKLLLDLFSENHHSFNSIEDGVSVIEDKLQKSRESNFLIVIDDADHGKQLEALVPPMNALNPKSLVIVTTRDERLLIRAGVRVSYRMKQMNEQHSKELFCWHAFHRKSCKNGFESLVDSFVTACAGLPLALRVLGGHVFGSDKAYWKLQLDAVKERPHEDIKQTLKISYDALEEDQKQIFMDIACFFIGKEVSEAMSVWKASKWRAEHALQTLQDKCLLELQLCFDHSHHFEYGDPYVEYGDPYVDAHEPVSVLRMHDHLRDLGRDMADNANPCRLWRRTDPTEMQSIITAAKEKNFRYFNDYSRELTYLLEISNTSTDLQWLQITNNPGSSDKDIPDWIPLQNLQSLRLNEVSAARLWQRDDQIPLKLKELYMVDSPSTNLLILIGMLKHLETLYVQFWNTRLRPFHWNCLLTSLRKLTHLKTLTLDLLNGEFTLSNRGKTIDDDLSPMRCLETITLSLKTIDCDLFPTRCLEAITLSSGSFTRKVSICGQVCPALKSLKLYSMKVITTVDLTEVTTLECLVLLDCEELTEVLCSGLVQLEMVHISGCHAMSKLPNFGGFRCLKRIYIRLCENLQDMSAIERLKGLKKISISNCPQLKDIKAIEQLKRLNRIRIEWCCQLKGVIGFKELKRLKRVLIGNCPRLQDIRGIESLICLESFIIAGCPNLQNITGIEELKGLKEMVVSDASSINCIEKFQRLPSELTILVGRPAKSDLIVDGDDEDEDEDSVPFLNAHKIGNTLRMADYFCETVRRYPSQQEVVEMIRSFHMKTQHSSSTFIFCAMYEMPVCMERDICNGTEIDICKGCHQLKEIQLCSDSYGGDWWIYMCAVNEERLSKYDSWMPTDGVLKAYFMGVKKGEERKTLCILQSLFAQLGLGKYREITEVIDWFNYDICEVYIDDLHEYDREDYFMMMQFNFNLHEYDREDNDEDDDDEYDV